MHVPGASWKLGKMSMHGSRGNYSLYSDSKARKTCFGVYYIKAANTFFVGWQYQSLSFVSKRSTVCAYSWNVQFLCVMMINVNHYTRIIYLGVKLYMSGAGKVCPPKYWQSTFLSILLLTQNCKAYNTIDSVSLVWYCKIWKRTSKFLFKKKYIFLNGSEA